MRTSQFRKLNPSKFRSDETGAVTALGLIIFVLILLVAGTAVDMMRYERERTGLQNAMDSGVIAASSLNQGVDPTVLVKDYVAKAGYDPDRVTVRPVTSETGGVVNGRSVAAVADFEMNTFFMRMMGFNELPGQAYGAALEGSQVLEIVLVLDISGSMGWDAAGGGTKMEALQTAAKGFVTTILNNSESDRVMISIVPYNQQVYMTTDLMGRLNLANSTETVPTPPAHPGAVTSYQTMNPASRCARFEDADFSTRRISDAADIGVAASFTTSNNNSYNTMAESRYWCGDNWPKILLYQNSETILHNHIDALTTQGMTAIDYGMNWAVGLLDPSFEPVISGMVTDKLVPDTVQDHPVAYGTPEVKKYIVLMTDGTNTLQQDLNADWKDGPSRVWFSETQANGEEFDGYLFEMPENDASERWLVPGSPTDDADDTYLAEDALPADAKQWTMHQLFRRFSVKNVAEYFYDTTEDAFVDAHVTESGYGDADTKLKSICTEAKKDAKVYAIAFEAPTSSATLLDGCSSGEGYFFDVDATALSAAFNAIAVQISLLRLTE